MLLAFRSLNTAWQTTRVAFSSDVARRGGLLYGKSAADSANLHEYVNSTVQANGQSLTVVTNPSGNVVYPQPTTTGGLYGISLCRKRLTTCSESVDNRSQQQEWHSVETVFRQIKRARGLRHH